MKEILIIGGGIAGLSAGIYAQRNGFKSTIYEKHSIVGGECTGWNRQGHHVDGCIHWLTGTKEGTALNNVWNETGAIGDVEINPCDEFNSFEFNGVSISLSRDLEKLRNDLNNISPEDKDEIDKFISNVYTVQAMDIPAEKPMDLMKPLELIKFMGSMKNIGKVIKDTNKVDCVVYGKRFKHPAIQRIFETAMPKGYRLSAFIFTLATFSSGNCGIPKGGSYGLAMRMKERYLSLGGNIKVNSEVKDIIIEDNTAKGITLKSGENVFADYIIPACDTHIVFEKLLKGKYIDKKFSTCYNNSKDYPVFSAVYAAFAVDCDLSSYPSGIIFESKPMKVGAQTVNVCGFKNYCHEPDFAPKGKSTIICPINQYADDYVFWKELSNDREKYRAEKERISNDIIDIIEEKYPELKGKIKPLDVATPVTYERYCGAYQGAYMSFILTSKSKDMMHNGKIKGLKKCYLAGQWLQPPGGLPIAVTTGKFAVQRICNEEKVAFN